LNWAKDNNQTVVNIYEDAGSSAFKGARKQFNRMMYDIESEALCGCIRLFKVQ